MSKLNANAKQKMYQMSVYEQARRTLVTCMLFEDNGFENGESITDRLARYPSILSEEECRKLLAEAKENKLRHAPAFWANKMLKNGKLKSADVETVVDRVDLMADLLSLYWNDKSNKHGLPKSLAKGLQKSFEKFDEYQFAKYKADGKKIKLKDVLKIVRPKPLTDAQSELYKKILDGNLATPDTWEVALSKCHTPAEKKTEWTRLLTEKTEKGYNKLGALALLRNLRNMKQAGVDENVIRTALSQMSMKKILPFQIVAAARYAPELEDILEQKLIESAQNYGKLEGDTIILVDVSYSMYSCINGKSEINSVDAASAVAAIVREACQNTSVYAFDTHNMRIGTSYRGFSLINEIVRKNGGCTAVIDCTNNAIDEYKRSHSGKYPARVITLTDEGENSSRGSKLQNLPKGCNGYMINVRNNMNSVTYGAHSGWISISGWSEAIVKYIAAYEAL